MSTGGVLSTGGGTTGGAITGGATSTGGAASTGGGGAGGGPAGCGNGIIDPGEECDDGNPNDADTCAGCKVQCTSEGSIATQPYTLVHDVTHHCYLLGLDPNSSWISAMNDCLAWGGYLAALTTQEEIDDMASLLVNTGEDIWIGGNDLAVDGTFVWVDGEDWTYVNGAPPWHMNMIGADEPNGATGENCVEMFKSGDLNDEHCDSSQNWLCERDPAGAIP